MSTLVECPAAVAGVPPKVVCVIPKIGGAGSVPHREGSRKAAVVGGPHFALEARFVAGNP
jgi:hypothetical protein